MMSNIKNPFPNNSLAAEPQDDVSKNYEDSDDDNDDNE